MTTWSNLGWHVDTYSPTSISTACRWITTIVRYQNPKFSFEGFTLFPVDIRPYDVLLYSMRRSGSALSQESQENIAPGDYGIYYDGKNIYFMYKSKHDEL